MRHPLLLCALLALTGCERPLYPDTYEELVEKHTHLPGTVYYATGDPYGPFRQIRIVTGEINTAGAMHPPSRLGEKPRITWPATPGYYYQGYEYETEFESPFYIIRKIPAAQRMTNDQ